MTERIRLLVLYGGRSAEHEVSRSSGHYVAACAAAAGLEVDLVGITQRGRWVRPPKTTVEPEVLGRSAASTTSRPVRPLTNTAEPDVSRLLPALDDDLPAVPIEAALQGLGVIGQQNEPGYKSGKPGDQMPVEAARQRPDDSPEGATDYSEGPVHPVEERQRPEDSPEAATVVVFPVLHGPFGEDGTVQGLCEMAGVPYVGPGVLASAACMDKPTSKNLLSAAGLPVARHAVLHRNEVTKGTPAELLAELGNPVFVKPANMGSSIGISKATSNAEVAEALSLAASYDEWLIAEESICGREIEVAVLGNTKLRASLPGEVVPAAEFYDYADKYLNGAATLHAPADLPDEAIAEAQRLAIRAARACRVTGLARVDFFYQENAEESGKESGASSGRGFVVNEINTMPGFTPISMYPRLWAVSGLDGPGLIRELARLALERHRDRNSQNLSV